MTHYQPGTAVTFADLEMDDGEEGDFDWMATLAAAGVASTERDLSHMDTADMIALLVAEESAATDLARSVGLSEDQDTPDRAPAGLSAQEQAELLQTVNAILLSKDHVAAQMQIVDLIPASMNTNGLLLARSSIERAHVLGLSDPGAPRALLARTVAFLHWRASHDPQRQVDDGLAIEAAASAPVILVNGQPAFDDEAFRDLIAFLGDLPW